MKQTTALLIFILLTLNPLLPAGSEQRMDPALKSLLKQQVEEREEVQIQDSLPVQLDAGVPGLEQAVLWTVLGPTYWRNQLSVVTKERGQWRLLATAPVIGMVTGFGPVQPDGTLVVQSNIQGPHDPLCCPSQAAVLYFSYQTGHLREVKPGRE